MKTRTGIILILFLCSSIPFHIAQATNTNTSGTLISVTTNQDVIADDGDCSLREAVQAANLDQSYFGCPAGSGTDTILLPIGTYALSAQGQGEDQGLIGDLDITDSLTILGDGIDVTTIDGMYKDRIFHVIPEDIQVKISDMTLKNGYVPKEDLLGGGAVLSLGDLILTRVKIQENSASRGGGVRNSLGRLLLTDSEVVNNQSNFEGGGIYGDGKIVIVDSQVNQNSSEFGGGISADELMELTRVTIDGNEAIQSGGGIYTDFETFLNQVTFSSNRAITGAGFYNNNDSELSNVTFGDNLAEDPNPEGSAHGGGIYNNGTLKIINNTLNENQAGRGGGIYNSELGQVTLVNTILADNSGGNCANFGEQISLGYNIEDTNSCKLDQPGDRPGTNPLLADLVDELDGTATFPLLSGSPAIDTALEDYCPYTDQRGVIRPVDGDRNGVLGCDIGAHENTPGGVLRFSPFEKSVAETAGSISLVVTRTGGDGTVGINYGPGAGTAVSHADFNLAPGSLSWSSSDHGSKSFPLEILDDIYAEDEEYGLIILSKATGGAGILIPGYLFRFIIAANDPGGPPQPYGPIFLPLSLMN